MPDVKKLKDALDALGELAEYARLSRSRKTVNDLVRRIKTALPSPSENLKERA